MSHNFTIESGSSVRLLTAGKYCDQDIVVAATGAVIEPLSVTKNGTYAASNGVDGYSPVTVNVPVPDGYIKPSGTLNITKNGSHNVTKYATANVNVPAGVTVQRVAGSYTTNAAGEAYVFLDFKPDLVVLSNNANFEKAAAYSALEKIGRAHV